MRPPVPEDRRLGRVIADAYVAFAEKAAGPALVNEWEAVEAATRFAYQAGREAAYHQFTITWDEALKMDRDHGGVTWKEFTS